MKARIQSGSTCLHASSKILRSNQLTRGVKVHIYKTIVRQVVMYYHDTWTLIKGSERKLRCFERKVLRTVFVPIPDIKKPSPSNPYKRELQEMFTEPDIICEVKGIKL